MAPNQTVGGATPHSPEVIHGQGMHVVGGQGLPPGAVVPHQPTVRPNPEHARMRTQSVDTTVLEECVGVRRGDQSAVLAVWV